MEISELVIKFTNHPLSKIVDVPQRPPATAVDRSSGYHADHPVVRVFWRVVHAMPEIWRRKLLLFCTGCDRVPILGLKALSLDAKSPVMVTPEGGVIKHGSNWKMDPLLSQIFLETSIHFGEKIQPAMFEVLLVGDDLG